MISFLFFGVSLKMMMVMRRMESVVVVEEIGMDGVEIRGGKNYWRV